MITVAGGGLFPSHPSRYMSEMGISLAFLVSIFIVKLTDFIRVQERIKLARINSVLMSNFIIVLILFLCLGAILVGKNRLYYDRGDALGIWDGIERGEIGKAREKFGGVPSVLGYAITLSSIV